jgi:uncharacterized hydrophobic protein (TIGR00271 family)
VIHLRIVAPSYQAQHVLDLLGGIPSVCNLVYLERAARKPEGDVILCDVAREDTSVVVGDLRELSIDVEGSIAMEEVDSQISAAALRAEKAAPGAPSDAVVWEEVESRTSENVELSASFLAFMAVAMMIAAVGIVTDQLVLIIGAMVVGPEFGPLAALAVALVRRRMYLARRAALALVVGFPVAMLVTAAGVLAGEAVGWIEVTSTSQLDEVDFIFQVGPLSFVVALLAGAAGMLSLVSAKSAALVGVFISVTTVPAAGFAVVAATVGDWAVAAESAASSR